MKIYKKKKDLLIRVTIEESDGTGFFQKETITLEECTFHAVVNAVLVSVYDIVQVPFPTTLKIQVREYTDKNGKSRSFTFTGDGNFIEKFKKGI